MKKLYKLFNLKIGAYIVYSSGDWTLIKKTNIPFMLYKSVFLANPIEPSNNLSARKALKMSIFAL